MTQSIGSCTLIRDQLRCRRRKTSSRVKRTRSRPYPVHEHCRQTSPNQRLPTNQRRHASWFACTHAHATEPSPPGIKVDSASRAPLVTSALAHQAPLGAAACCLRMHLAAQMAISAQAMPDCAERPRAPVRDHVRRHVDEHLRNSIPLFQTIVTRLPSKRISPTLTRK